MSSQSMGKDFILFAIKASRLMDNGDVKQALNLCEAGVRRFPAYAPGHYILGTCYQALDQKEEAKNEFERVLHYDPSHTAAMQKLADNFEQAGLPEMANALLIKAALYSPLDDNLIKLLKEKDLYNQLISDFSEPENLANEEEFIEDEDIQDLVSEHEESADIDNLDPLAENVIYQDEKPPAEEQKSKKSDLSQYANTEDDFSTIMKGYFDKDETIAEKKPADNDEWIEVENLLIDEQPPVVKEREDDTTESVRMSTEEIDPLQEEIKDETEMLLEELSQSELENGSIASKQDRFKKVKEEENSGKTIDEKTLPDDINLEQTLKASRETSPDDPDADVTINDLVDKPHLVTPTFGEILIAQHKFYEARHVFKELSKKEPDNTRFVKKIQFLDKFLDVQDPV